MRLRKTPVPGPPLRPEAAAAPVSPAPPLDVRKTLSYEDVPLPESPTTGAASVSELPSPPGVSPRAPDEAGQGEGKPALTGTVTVGTRTTVLPRLEVVGAETRLTNEPRPRFEVPVAQGPERDKGLVRAIDNDLGRVVVIERPRPDARDDVSVARFVSEMRTTGLLEHPNIVPIHDVGVDERGDFFFVMKNVEGETLASIIDKLAAGNAEYHRRYSFERRIEIFQKILDAIHFAHARGVIHRDIKPANVLVGCCGEVVVTGWGRAKSIREPGAPAGGPSAPVGAATSAVEPRTQPPSLRAIRTRMGSITGSPAYLAPEQVPARAGDERSDVYSLCVLLHEFLGLEHYLSHKTTVEGILRGVILDSFKPSALVRKGRLQPPVPADLAWFVAKGLRKNPDERYGSVQEMIVRLQERREGLIPIQCHLTALRRLTGIWSRFLDRHPLAVTLILALMIVSLLGMVVRLALR